MPVDEMINEFDFGVSIVRHSEVQRGKWIIEGYATTIDLGTDNAIITEDALRLAEKDLLERSTVLYNHNQDNPIGKVLRSEVKDKGLWIKVMISRTQQDIWNKIQEGVLNKFSIRGKILDSKEGFSKEHSSNVTFITGIKFLEVSVVSVPAVSQAEILQSYVERKHRKEVEILNGKEEKASTEETNKEEEVKRAAEEKAAAEAKAQEEIIAAEKAASEKESVREAEFSSLTSKIDAVLGAVQSLTASISSLVTKKTEEEITANAKEKEDEAKRASTLEEEVTSVKKKLEDVEKKLSEALIVRGFSSSNEEIKSTEDAKKEAIRSIVDDKDMLPKMKLEKVLAHYYGNDH